MTTTGALPLPGTPGSTRNRPPGAAGGRGASGAPFASALQNALAADRSPTYADRAADRRTSPDDRGRPAASGATGAAFRATDAASRAADAAARSGERAARKTDRAADAAARTGRRSDDRRAETVGEEATAVDGQVPVVEPPPTESAAAPLSPALWVIPLGGSVGGTAPAATSGADGAAVAVATAPTDAAGAGPLPVAAVATPAAGDVPTALLGAGAPVASAAAGIPRLAALDATSPPPAGTAVAAANAQAPATLLPSATPPAVGTAPPTAATAVATPTTDGSPAAGSPAAGSPAVPAPPVAAVGSARSSSSDAGNPRHGSPVPGAPAGDSVPEIAPLASAPGPTSVAATLATAVAGPPGAAAALPVGSQVARQVAVLGRGPDGAHTMTLVLNPENLGPVEVSVSLTKGTIGLTLRGAHELGRAALLDGLPDLRRDLEGAGLTPSRLEVDRDTGGSWLARHAAQQQADQQGSGSRHGQPGSRPDGGDRSRPWDAPADTAVSGPTPRNRATSSGVDLLA